MNRRIFQLGLLLAPALTLALVALGDEPPLASGRAPAADAGTAYRVPYRLTDTNHFLVRVRINGKGPFNFLVDTGAPALYVATETAKKIGLAPREDEFWTPVDRIDFEGGATLRGIPARVEDPFQLVGMNALGLPGASIDGILGFTVLARFKIELDPTQDRMTWTRLSFEPRDPPAPRRRPGAKMPANMQAMNALGPLSKVAALLIGKQPEVKLVPRGFLGIELAPGEGSPRVERVLEGSPADKAGVMPGDRIARIGDTAVTDAKAATSALASTRPGDRARLVIRRGEGDATTTIDVTAGEGL